jgi:cytochrome d ubiquinol oxidase subunit I
VTGSIFVMAISAWFLLKGRNEAFAKRSMTVAAAFGLACSVSVVVLGDESGYQAGKVQPMKVAAIESEWKTEAAPADFTLFGLPNQAARRTDDEIKLPWLLGIIATRSVDQVVPGIDMLVKQAEGRIRSGMIAYGALLKLRAQPEDAAARAALQAHVNDLGYGLLLRRYTNNVTDATPAQIEQAAWSTVPRVFPLFWAFRLMVGIGFFFIAYFAGSFWLSARRQLDRYRWFLRLSVLLLPLPWLSSELGWFVAENGRQPWTIDGILPTYLSASSVSAGTVGLSLIGFVLFYSALAVVELFLMIKYVRLGPEYEKRAGTKSGAQLVGAGE